MPSDRSKRQGSDGRHHSIVLEGSSRRSRSRTRARTRQNRASAARSSRSGRSSERRRPRRSPSRRLPGSQARSRSRLPSILMT